ncbi:MAG: hypothetical protein QM753_18145 [Thermomicrobiales bacterium]
MLGVALRPGGLWLELAVTLGAQRGVVLYRAWRTTPGLPGGPHPASGPTIAGNAGTR